MMIICCSMSPLYLTIRLKRVDLSVSYVAPSIWNCLPYYLRTCTYISKLKKLLDTGLFEQAFGHV